MKLAYSIKALEEQFNRYAIKGTLSKQGYLRYLAGAAQVWGRKRKEGPRAQGVYDLIVETYNKVQSGIK